MFDRFSVENDPQNGPPNRPKIDPSSERRSTQRTSELNLVILGRFLTILALFWAILVPPRLIFEPLGGHFGPSGDQFCCPCGNYDDGNDDDADGVAVEIAEPSTLPSHRPRRAVDLAAPSTLPRHRHRRAVDFAAPSTSPRCRPRSAIDLAAPVDVAAPTGRSPGYPLGNPRGSPWQKSADFLYIV